MQNTPHDIEFNELSSTQPDEDNFIPIDPDWKTKYYKKVLKKRIKSYWLDVLIINLFIIVLILFSLLIGDEETKVNFIIIGYLLLVFGYPVPVAIMESSKWKGFFGKRIMKIEVSDNYGNPISFWRSIWRNFLKGLTFFVCITIIGYYIQKHYYLKTGKLMHDNWSKTVIGERLGN
jgi:uncharacterized RDD family membrane protein YckC